MPFLTLCIYGFLAALFALIIEFVLLIQVLNVSALSFVTFLSLLATASIEEISKYLFLRQYWKRFFQNLTLIPRDAVLLGAVFGLSFTGLEVLLVTSFYTAFELFPLLGIFLVHIATSILLSLFIFSRSWKIPLSGILSLTIILHLLYNLWVSFGL